MKAEMRTKRLAASTADSELDIDIEIRLVQARFTDTDPISRGGHSVRNTAGDPRSSNRGGKPCA